MSEPNEPRRPKTAKSTREAKSRLRSDLGLRYLPESAKPFTDDTAPMFCPGLGIAVFDVHEDQIRRHLLQHGFITQTAIDSDDAERSHKRIDAAIGEYVNTVLTLIKSNALRGSQATADGTVQHDETGTGTNDANADAESRPNRSSNC